MTRTFILDANGDGLSDFVIASPINREDLSRTKWRGELYLSTGRSFEFASASPDFLPTSETGFANHDLWSKGFVVDIDSDGRDELLIPSKEVGWIVHKPYTRESPQADAWTTQASTMPFVWARLVYDRFLKPTLHKERFGFQGPVVLDWDGDGVSEIAIRAAPDSDLEDINHPVFELWKAAPRTQNLLQAITDGLGKRTDIVYDSGKPLKFANSSSRGYVFGGTSTCTYPQRCMGVLPHPIVVEHSVSAYAGNYSASHGQPTIKVSYEYKYFDAREDLRGRGWLGFRRREIREYADAGRLVKQTNIDYEIEKELVSDSPMYAFAGYPGRVETITTSGTQAPIVIEGLDPAVTQRTVVTNEWVSKVSQAGIPYVALNSRTSETLEAPEGGAERRADLRSETFGYDAYGNRIAHTSSSSDLAVSITVVAYAGPGDTAPGLVAWSELEEKWLVGLPRLVLQLNIRSGPEESANKGYQLFLSYEGSDGAKGHPTKIERYGMLGDTLSPLRQEIALGYDDFGNEETRTLSGPDSVTQTFTTKFDDRGMFPIELHNALHDAAGMPPTKVGVDARTGLNHWLNKPDGSWAVVNRDGFGRTVSVVESAGARERTQYIAGGTSGGALRVRVTGVGRATTETEYNSYGLPIEDRITEAVGGVTKTSVQERAYDARGALFAQGVMHWSDETAPEIPLHVFTHDNLGRIVMEVHTRVDLSDNHRYPSVRHHTYWTSAAPLPGEEASVTVPVGSRAHRVTDVGEASSTLSVYNPRGKLTTVVDSHHVMSKFAYDAMDHLLVADVAGVRTSSLSDESGRVIYMLHPDVGRFDFVYNGLGLLRHSYRNGIESRYDYDALGRKVSSVTPDGSYEWDYDGDGTDPTLIGHLVREAVSSATLGSSTTGYLYSNPGARLSSIRREIEGETFETAIVNDSLGRASTIQYPGTVPFSAAYQYEGTFGRLEEVREGGTGAALWKLEETDAFGHARRVSYKNGMQSTRTYYPETGELDTISLRGPTGERIYAQSIGYDYRGLVTARTTLIPGEDEKNEIFGYDALGRLTSHTKPDGGVDSFGYDELGLGNLKSTPEGTLLYDHPGPHQVSGTTNGDVYRYENGNQTYRAGPSVADGEQHIAYSAFDLPREITSGTKRTSFHYDASGKRIAVFEPNGVRRLYVGDSYDQTTEVGKPTIENVRVATPDGMVLEVTPKQSGPHEYRYLQTDHLGSTIAVLSEQRTVLERRSYAPFGQSTSTGITSSRWGFTGHEHDASLGLINMGGRMYDPRLRRFLSVDPIVQDFGDAQSWNPYSYVRNSPLSATDPTGFSAESPFRYDIETLIAKALQAGATQIDFEEGSTVTASVNPASVTEAKPAPAVNQGAAAPTHRIHTPRPAEMEADSTMANLGSFGLGAIQGALGTAAMSAGLGYGAGAVAAGLEALGIVATAATAAPVIVTAATAGLVAWGIYALASGGAEQIANSVERVATGRGSSADWNLVGNLFGGGVAGLRAGAMVEAGMEAAAADVASTEVMGIVSGGAARGIPGGVCFTTDTPIATEDGPVPIQDLRVGDRVLTYGELQSSETAVGPATWRLVRLEMPNPDGSEDVLEIELLRPLTWLAEHQASVGVDIEFVLEEMGLEGPALVVGVEPCPEIKQGTGRVVLATVTHLNGEVLEIRFEGNETVLEPTARHRLFSADRNDWIPAGHLEAGEELVTSHGNARIASTRPKPGVHRVYNIEVETEHSFLASDLEVLSHNTNPCAAPIIELAAKSGAKLAQQIARWRSVGGVGGAQEFLSFASGLATRAQAAGNFVTGTVGSGAGALTGATIYREGSQFLVVQGGRIMSYVAEATSGGIVDEFVKLGGKL